MLIRFWLGQAIFARHGRFSHHPFDASIGIFWRWRGDVPVGALAWRRIWRFSWNWLPDRRYRSLKPTMLLPPTDGEVLESAIANREPKWVEVEDKAGITGFDSTRWTGRERKFLGFGAWRREFVSHRATWRSLMHVYLTGAKERANFKHTMWVAPATQVPAAECPSEWKNEDGTAKTFSIEFVYGRAAVDSNLGEWLIKSGTARRSNIVRAASGSMLGTLAKTIAGR